MFGKYYHIQGCGEIYSCAIFATKYLEMGICGNKKGNGRNLMFLKCGHMIKTSLWASKVKNN